MSTKKKFYVVWKGRKTGIFQTWDACSASVAGYPGAEYKSFESLQAAEAALRGAYNDFKGQSTSSPGNWRTAKNRPQIPSLCVDAACAGNPGEMEYRGVDIETGQLVFHQGPYTEGTNNIGEFLAIVHALALLARQGRTLPIYSDSENAISWVRQGKCKTKLPRNERNQEVFTLIERAESWLRQNPAALETYRLYKWETTEWGEIPADFGRK